MLYGMASAETVAWVMYQKFCNSLPYYPAGKRLETVWCCDHQSYYGKLGDPKYFEAFFLPMYEYFHRKLLEQGIRDGR